MAQYIGTPEAIEATSWTNQDLQCCSFAGWAIAGGLAQSGGMLALAGAVMMVVSYSRSAQS